MHFNSNVSLLFQNVSELAIWSSGIININDIYNLDLYEFEVYREIFKNKFETESESKSEFIKGLIEFAKRCVESICKTIAGAYGTRAGKLPNN